MLTPWDSLVFSVWLPWLVIGLFALATLWSVCRDRYRRRLALAPSKEAAAIERLREGGAIQSAEAARLLREVDALPEIREVAPLPDRPLRLAVALTHIYAGMHLIYFLYVTAAMLYIAATAADHPAAQGEWNVSIPPWSVAVLLAIAPIGLLAGLYRAAGRTLAGSLRARNWAVGLWVACLALLRYDFGGDAVWASRIAMLAMGGWAVWTFLLRRDATRHVSHARAEPPRGRKIAWGAALAVLIAAGSWIDSVAMTLRFRLDRTSFQTNTSTSHSGTVAVVPRLRRLYVVAATPEPAVGEIAEALARRFAGEMDTPAEAVAFGAPFDAFDDDRDLCLLVFDGRTPPPPPPLFPRGGPAIDWEKLLPDSLRRANAGRPAADRPGYHATLLTAGVISEQKRFGVHFPAFGFSFDASVVVLACPRRQLGEKVAEQIATPLCKLLQPACGPSALEPPPWPARGPAAEPPAWLDFSALDDARPMVRGASEGYTALEAWTFRKGDYAEDLRRIAEHLAERGYARAPHDGVGGAIEFLDRESRRETRVKVDMGYGDNTYSADRPLRLEYGTIVRADTRPIAKADFETDAAFVAGMRQTHLRTLMLGGGFEVLPPEERLAAVRDFFALPHLTAAHRIRVLRSMLPDPRKEPDPDTEACFAEMFRRTVEERISPPGVPPLADPNPAEVVELIFLSRDKGREALETWLLERLGERHIRVDAPADGDTESGIVRVTAELTVDELLAASRFVEFASPRHPSVWLALSWWPDGENRYGSARSLNTGQGSWGQTSTGQTIEDVLENNWAVWGGQISGDFSFHSSKGAEPSESDRTPGVDKATFIIEPDLEARRLRMEFLYRPWRPSDAK